MQVYMHKCIVVREAGISAYISMCIWPQHYCTMLSALIDDLLVLVPTFVACIAENMEGHAERSPVQTLIPEASRVAVKVVFCILVRCQANATQLSCPASSMSL